MINKEKFNRFHAWFDMMILDHGFLRLVYHNFHQIDKNMYRSNMPTPLRIKNYKLKFGIKTIINLRGENKNGGWLLENEACKSNNIRLINLTARSRAAPNKDLIFKAEKIFNQIEYPALLHCKSGADRAGIVSALYKLLYCGEKPEIAKKQLSLKYLHIKWAKTGILDKFVEEYQTFKSNNKKISFIEWVKNIYNPKKLEKEFRSNKQIDKILFNLFRRE